MNFLYKDLTMDLWNQPLNNLIPNHLFNIKWCYCPLEQVKNRLNNTGYPTDKLHYIVGDVMDTLTLNINIPKEIAVLCLDTDWYESSKYELYKLYDNVVDKLLCTKKEIK